MLKDCIDIGFIISKEELYSILEYLNISIKDIYTDNDYHLNEITVVLNYINDYFESNKLENNILNVFYCENINEIILGISIHSDSHSSNSIINLLSKVNNIIQIKTQEMIKTYNIDKRETFIFINKKIIS